MAERFHALKSPYEVGKKHALPDIYTKRAGGKLSMQKYPASSKHLSACDFPEPERPLITTNLSVAMSIYPLRIDQDHSIAIETL
jgi:hypothetical protein